MMLHRSVTLRIDQPTCQYYIEAISYSKGYSQAIVYCKSFTKLAELPDDQENGTRRVWLLRAKERVHNIKRVS